MSDQPTISVYGVSKSYNSDVATDKIELRSGSHTSKQVLSDVTFELQRGQILGIIGKNGSGKSTLLKIIAGITKPSSGKVVTTGSIASILEIGTGFHPELSGKENVFLSAAILGMSDAEVKFVYKDIVEFSGLRGHMDMPIKRYSTGMFMRLAFSIIVHINADILILDEVFSVGDLGFVRKCEHRLAQLMGSSKTVLIASHDLGSVSKIASHVIVLKRGRQDFFGNLHEGITNYIESTIFDDQAMFYDTVTPVERPAFIDPYSSSNMDVGNNPIGHSTKIEPAIKYECPRHINGVLANNWLFVEKAWINPSDPSQIPNDKTIELSFTMRFMEMNDLRLAMALSRNLKEPVLVTAFPRNGGDFDTIDPTISFDLVVKIPRNLLNEGIYSVSFFAINNNETEVGKLEDILFFKVYLTDEFCKAQEFHGHFPGGIVSPLDWTIKNHLNQS